MVSEKFKEIARRELREDEQRKQQALEHFREWLNKHPYIIKVRQDDRFLLQFLRTKKYSMDRVFATFENCVMAKRKYSKWFDWVEEDYTKMMELYYAGYVYPLIDRDEHGRRVIFIQLRKLDPNYFTAADAIRLSAVISSSLLEEEETQIAGIATIIDIEGITMKHTSLFSVTDTIDFANCMKTAVGRYKQLFLVNMPSFASYFLDVARSTLSEKLKKRIVLPKNMDEMRTYIDPKMLPAEYGGTYPEAHHMKTFTDYFHTVRDDLEAIKASEIDWPKVPESRNSAADNAVGSFRKLEID